MRLQRLLVPTFALLATLFAASAGCMMHLDDVVHPDDAGTTSPEPSTAQDKRPATTPPSTASEAGADATTTQNTPVADASADVQLDASPAPDAAPVRSTFAIGATDCNGGHCQGGYDGVKDDALLPTAHKQCKDRAFVRAIDFTIGDQPGGRFCVFGSGGAYGCDQSCDGCNTMATVICER